LLEADMLTVTDLMPRPCRPVSISLLWFALGGLQFSLSGHAADVSLWQATKGFEYTQTDGGVPTLNATNGCGFEADVVMSTNTSVTAATVQPPGGLPQTLTLSASGTKLSFKHKYNSLTRLNQHYANGAYAFHITTKNDGTRQVSSQLLGDAYPNAPHLHNFAALQAVNANGYLAALWDVFVGGDTNDFIQFRIEDQSGNKLFETPDLNKSGALDGTATQVLVPPGTLAPGTTYRLTLAFHKAVAIDRTSYPGAAGYAAYYSRTALSLATSTAAAPDVKTFELYKARKWVQSGTNTTIPEPGHEFAFDASIQTSIASAVASATVLPPPPNSTSRNLVLQPGGTTLAYSGVASSQAALDSLYGAGGYTLAFGTAHDGSKSLTLALPTDAFPPAPRIADFDALQTVDPTSPIAISWDGWNGGDINDFIQVRIQDAQQNKFFETPNLGQHGALDGRATSALVPAGALPPNQGFEIHLTFKKVVTRDTVSYPGALGLSTFQARTKMSIQTSGPASPPQLTLTILPASQARQLSFAANPGSTYRIEGSSNLVQWVALSTNMPSSPIFQWEDTNQYANFFYRVAVLP
jgi:hypothetical protein